MVSLVARNFSIPAHSPLTPSLYLTRFQFCRQLPKKLKKKPTLPNSCRGRGQKWDFRDGQGIWKGLGHVRLSVCMPVFLYGRGCYVSGEMEQRGLGKAGVAEE